MPASIAQQIMAEIRSGALPPGSVLQQEALAARFAASRCEWRTTAA